MQDLSVLRAHCCTYYMGSEQQVVELNDGISLGPYITSKVSACPACHEKLVQCTCKSSLKELWGPNPLPGLTVTADICKPTMCVAQQGKQACTVQLPEPKNPSLLTSQPEFQC